MSDANELSKRIEDIVREVVDQVLPEQQDRKIPIGISARHLHIKQEHLEQLFGPGYQLTKYRDLKQPGEFAAEESVCVVGPNRRSFERVRILGPLRSATQVEMSFTDGRYLGLDLPTRISGDLEKTAPITLIGPRGVVRLEQGAIRAMRHLHLNPQDAAFLGVENGQNVSVRTEGPNSVVFNNVVVRIKEGLKRDMHVDTDEANAAGLDPRNAFGFIVK
jgi:propanediol utilization protein